MIVYLNGQKTEIPEEFTALLLVRRYGALSLCVNGKAVSWDYKIQPQDRVDLLQDGTPEGERVLRRTLVSVLVAAFKKVHPNFKLRICQPVYRTFTGEVEGDRPFDRQALDALRTEMDRIIAADFPIVPVLLDRKRLLALYQDSGFVISDGDVCLEPDPVYGQQIDDIVMYIKGIKAPSTGVVKEYGLTLQENGFVLSCDPLASFSAPLTRAMRAHRLWEDILDIRSVPALNRVIVNTDTRDMVHMQESLTEKRVSALADSIKMNQPKVKVILITGPSSSGKTTLSYKLNIALRVIGLTPINISLDDYFLPREKIPKDEFGNPGIENLEALNYPLFNRHLKELLSGKCVDMPIYDFTAGRPLDSKKTLQLQDGQVLIVEGIHALNEQLTHAVPRNQKFKIYCSPLVDLNYDAYNSVSSSDIRLLRRMVRDHLFRSTDAQGTLSHWPNVQRGERRNIFPYTETADVIFNSAIIYEPCLMRTYASPLLSAVSAEEPNYYEAKRLLRILERFAPMDDRYIPSNAFIREFIGNSSFHY